MTAQLANGGHKIFPKIVVKENQESAEKIKMKMQKMNILNSNQDKSILKATENFFEIPMKEYESLVKNKENINFVLDAMFKSKNEIYWTSYNSRIEDPKYQFAGKTGTAQVKRITAEERELDLDIDQIPYKQRDHAWYIAFGPYINPRYAVSVLVEHGGSGSKAAAPIAKKLFKKIIDRHELRKKIIKKGLQKA